MNSPAHLGFLCKMRIAMPLAPPLDFSSATRGLCRAFHYTPSSLPLPHRRFQATLSGQRIFSHPVMHNFGPRGENCRTIVPEQVINAQVGYEFKSGPFKGLTVLLQGDNLTNEPLKTCDQNDPRLVADYQRYGVCCLAGVSFKF